MRDAITPPSEILGTRSTLTPISKPPLVLRSKEKKKNIKRRGVGGGGGGGGGKVQEVTLQKYKII